MRDRASRFPLWLPKVLLALGLIVLVLLLIVLLLALVPVSTADLESDPDPVSSYDEAVLRIEAIQADEAGRVCSDGCGTTLLTHGQKTTSAVILIHGLTNSPRQFLELGQQLYDHGYNVFIPRMPGHGLKSLDVGELSDITATDLRLFADESADIAQGLGERVEVAGLSGGGTVAAWIAQNRADVDRAMPIAPFLGIYGVPAFAENMLVNLFSRVPNLDLSSSSDTDSEHNYRGEATRAVSQFLLLGKATREQADEQPSAVRDIIIVTNDNDEQVDNRMTYQLMVTWEEGGARITDFRFPRDLELHHDIIDMVNVKEKSAITYPVLISLLETGTAPPLDPGNPAAVVPVGP